MFENIGPGHGLESSRTAGATSGCNWEAAVEVDAIGEQQLKQTQTGAVVEADRCNWGAATEADAIGEQQLCTESCSMPNYSRRQTRGKQLNEPFVSHHHCTGAINTQTVRHMRKCLMHYVVQI